MTAPAQHPAAHFLEARQFHAQFRATALEVAQLLRGMPTLLANVTRRELIKAQYHVEFPLPAHHAETVVQPLFEGKPGRARESLAGLSHTTDARGDKSPDIFAGVIEGEEEPFAV